jgi:hypothetical protein
MEVSKQSWMDMFNTSGMRRRVIICSFLGLFTQWSGNGLISYYLVRVLETVGITKQETRLQINLGQTIWGFVNGTFMALMVFRFKRRVMYLACTISLTLVYTSLTVASQQYTVTQSKGASIGKFYCFVLNGIGILLTRCSCRLLYVCLLTVLQYGLQRSHIHLPR